MPHTPSTVSQHPAPGSTLPALCPRFICLCEQFGLSSTRCCCAWVWARGQDPKWNHRSCSLEQTEGHMKIRCRETCSPHPNLPSSLSQMCPPLAFAQAVLSAGKPSLSVVSHLLEAQCGSPHSSACLPGVGVEGGGYGHGSTALCQNCQSPARSGSAQDVWMGHPGPGELMLPRREQLQHTGGRQ